MMGIVISTWGWGFLLRPSSSFHTCFLAVRFLASIQKYYIVSRISSSPLYFTRHSSFSKDDRNTKRLSLKFLNIRFVADDVCGLEVCFKCMDLNLSSLFLRHRIIFNLLEVLLPQIYACPQVMIGMHFIVFDLK